MLENNKIFPIDTFRPILEKGIDNVFIEFAANAYWLITGNIKEFIRENELIFDDLKFTTSSDFISFWRKNFEK